jgi:hypothetical protein
MSDDLRDQFAAAALTGLLAQGDDGSFSEESYARAAYRWADVMLAERKKNDAEVATRNGTPTGRETVQEPVAWAVMYPGGFCIGVVALHKHLAEERAAVGDTVVPLYAAPPQDRVVRLPKVPDEMISTDKDTEGWLAAFDAFTEALDAAGVRWEYEDATSPTSDPR